MNPGRDEEIAAAAGAHRDLGPAYDDAIAAGLVERIGAEVDRRVDERISQYQHDTRPAADGQISWQQAILALGSMAAGAIASAGINTDHGGTWGIIFLWIAIAFINMTIFRSSRPTRSDRRSPH